MPSVGSDDSLAAVPHSRPSPAPTTGARSRALTWMPSATTSRRKHRVFFGALFFAAMFSGLAGTFGAYLMLLSWPASLGQIRGSSWEVLPAAIALLRVPFTPELAPFLPIAGIAAIVFPSVFHWFRLLTPPTGRIVPFTGVGSIAKAVGLSTLLLYLLFTPQFAQIFPHGRHYAIMYFVYFAAVSMLSALLLRSGALSLIYALRSFGVGHTRVAIVARGDAHDVRAALDRPESEHRLVGVIASGANAEPAPSVLGGIDDLARIINAERVDEVLLAVDPGELTVEQRMRIAETCWKLGVELKMVTPFHPYFRTTARTETIGDLTLLRVEPSGLYTTRSQVIKRLIDIAVSLVALIVLSPLLLVVALLVKFTSPGPILFLQERPGLHGRVFRILKFRTMRYGAETDLHREAQRRLIQEGAPAGFDENGRPIYGKVADDPRVTPLGRWLRRTSIDELPQLWNVLRGEMSLVGPRPAVLADIENFKDWHYQRHDIRPGLTGLWQVSGRSRLSFDQMVELDIKYIEEWSIWLDIKIMVRTIPALLKIDQAF